MDSPWKLRVVCAFAVVAASPSPARAEEAPKPKEAEIEPGKFAIPGLETTLSLNGYVQLDVVYDFKARDPNVEGHDYAAVASRLPLDASYEGREKTGQLYMTARTSRIGISTETDARIGIIGSRLEGDFWSGNLLSGQTFTNSVLFRLRHAYGSLSGTYGSLLVGQTWTTYADLDAGPETVDFNGPASGTGIRQPMIRYTTPMLGHLHLSVAAENAPGTDQNGVFDGPGTAEPITRKMQMIPDFIANLAFVDTWGDISAAAVTTRYQVAAGPNPGESGYAKQGWGGRIGGAVKMFGDVVRANVSGGRGIGRYAFAAGATGQGATDTGSGFVLWDELGYHVDYMHVWSPQFRSNLVWSQVFFENNGASTAAAPYEPTIDGKTGAIVDPIVNQGLTELYVNTFWTLNRQVEIGLEYGFGQRHTFGNDAAPDPCVPGIRCGSLTGTMHRVTSTIHVNLF